MGKFTLVSLTLIIIGQYSFSQASPNPADYSKTTDIIPPAPNAASLGTYGGLNFGLFTGTMSHSIPIYDYASTNISVPISISYHSNGVRVDEIASRVGVSWSLNAGGVISRTVNGRVDESATRVKPPASFPDRDRALIDFMDGLALADANGGHNDDQPDLFSFNFNSYNGQFILDSSNNAILLSHANIKVETDLSSSAWNFKITTPDGVQYIFGGSGATEMTTKLNVGEGCGKNYSFGVPTAFYLKQIIHPNNDVVNFVYSGVGYSYKTGTIESIYNRDIYNAELCSTGSTPPTFNNTTCISRYSVSGVRLDEINSSAGNKIKFYYNSRSDGVDVLLSKIEVYQPSNTNPIRLFSFDYNYSYATNFLNTYSYNDETLKYRPFLTKFIEKSADEALSKTYQFTYNDINGLPPRLSFSQDDYGIFNGKNNNTLIPKPTFLVWQDNLPAATANRTVDPEYGIKGLLSKIVYPTRGSDTIIYEANTIYTNVPIPLPDSVIFAQVSSGSGGVSMAYSSQAIIGVGQETHLYASCGYSGPPNEYDPIHCTGQVFVNDVTVPASPTTVYSNTTLHCGNTLTPPRIDLQAGHTYVIKVVAGGYYSDVSASMSYKYGTQTYQLMNKQVGGLRVKKIITTDSVAMNQTTKKYIYANLNFQNQSSGGLVYEPIYEKYLDAYVACSPCGSACQQYAKYWYYSMYSYSQNNIYAYTSAPVTYGSVIESFGEDFENGGIEHKYTVVADEQGTNVLGYNFLGVPLSSNSWQNAREYYQQIFKKLSGNYIPVKKVFNHFKDDQRIDEIFTAYLANKKYTPLYEYNPPSNDEFNAYDLFKYSVFRKWSYIDTVRTLTYDNAGQNYIEDTVVTEYANVNHAQPTKISKRGSNIKLNVVNNYYPQDISLTGPEEIARQALISKHITSPVLQIQTLTDGNQTMKVKINYGVFSNGLVLPKEQYIQTFQTPIEKRVEFFKYSNVGKVAEQGKSSDLKLSYIWNYNLLYPVAEVKNADSLNIVYTSFEGDNKGNWSYNGSAAFDASAPTGKNIYILNGANGITKDGLGSGTTYIVSYWTTNNSAFSIAGTITGYPMSGRSIGDWKYFEHRVTGQTQISLTGTGNIDEVRLYPVTAQMTTYTYDPLIGITSQCDQNNRISYFEYDGLGRLSLVRDMDKNIVKKLCYNYAGQEELCTQGCTTTNADWQNTSTPLRCKTVGGINTGEQEQEQKDMNLCSSTYNTIRWVVVNTNCTVCAKPANWQSTGNYRCVQSGGVNTGQQEREERDNESCSSTYNQTRWVSNGTNCSSCPKPANWQSTGNYRCVQNGGVNTGQQEREERDNENCSSTYNQTRWVSNGTNCSSCPKPANWQSTGNYRCLQSGGVNTGYQEREERDNESCSSTYNQIRWVSNGYNTVACPLACPNCTQSNQKCINGVCETGTKICISSYFDYSIWMYVNTYYYEWSDGSSSPSFNEYDFCNCTGSECF
jgi:hypothetical protein